MAGTYSEVGSGWAAAAGLPQKVELLFLLTSLRVSSYGATILLRGSRKLYFTARIRILGNGMGLAGSWGRSTLRSIVICSRAAFFWAISYKFLAAIVSLLFEGEDIMCRLHRF
jgi:hypothetical protein